MFAFTNQSNTHNMADIIAVNKKGETRKFNELTWKLMGADKNGWTKMADQPIAQEQPIVLKPKTGEKVTPPVVEQPIDNVVKTDDSKNEQPIDDKKTSDKLDAEKKKEFLKAAKLINAGNIKDYFDLKKIKYKQSAKQPELMVQLSEQLNFNLDELNKAFN